MARSSPARVCVLGAESTGKTTLTRELAERYETLWNPEYGRIYTEVGRPPGAPWQSWEFTHIARVHCWYEDFLAASAPRILFCDTDAFTTAVFHEAYLGAPATEFADLVERRHDLYLVCGLDVPFTQDGWRDLEEQRRWMQDRLQEHARGSGSPWLSMTGTPAERLAAATEAVEQLLRGSALPSRT